MNKNSKWTDKEILLLKKYYPTKGCIYIADQLGRTRSSVYKRAAKLGIKVAVNTSLHAYSPQEIIFIKKNYPLKGSHYVAKKLGRSPAAIKRKASELRVERQSILEWGPDEIEYLKKWYKKKRPSEIARHLKRTTGAVLVRARMLGLFKKFMRRWTNDEEYYLLKNYRNMTYKQIGKHLNRTRRSVQHKAIKMRLVKMIEKDWTPQEKKLLTRFYGKKHISEIVKRLNRTRGSIKGRAEVQKLKKKGPPDYTEKEKKFIRENYLKLTNEQIAKKLNRTKSGIAIMGMKLGLVGSREKQQLVLKARTDLYADDEKEFIRKNYLNMTNKEIAKKLNRPVLGIHDIAAKLGLTSLPGKNQLWVRGNIETHYTKKEKEFIRKNYLKMTNEQIAKKLKRSSAGIARMISKLGLSGHPKRRQYLKKIRRKKNPARPS
jgi:hypothetical protein